MTDLSKGSGDAGRISRGNPAPTTSTTLLRQIGGDVRHARWAEFVARYTPMCRQYLRRHFPSLEADDLLQLTFAAMAKALPHYRYVPEEKGHFRNYIVGVLRNKALMAMRKLKNDTDKLARYASDPTHSGPAAAASRDYEKWKSSVFEIALQQLLADTTVQDRTKQIFIRTAINQEPPEEVAQSLGVSRNVVDQQKRRTLAKFKALVAALKGVV